MGWIPYSDWQAIGPYLVEPFRGAHLGEVPITLTTVTLCGFSTGAGLVEGEHPCLLL